ncbi:hypothetical protein RHGRI_011329 [Rhododendron griersonianum]|uniref:C3H1-type domain-containing protein n=1 Tax=Rhododendron griersonianum TaxID=479676 RepID=A0AAV6KLV6_9ERIC|nr:hypothetical protein RHGRI_011329 [Rhododendron griersonianum]KAG5553412.1 hypothetical protein RHGRI_011329 [Rhododendron griersonianum]KAG5553413.1 hypothetical protein RHGRI_011329 [Rhododendron griersonianum]
MVKHRVQQKFAGVINSFNSPGRPIIVDYSPVTDFREATCRQYDEDVCNRGGYCNFMHLKKISRELRRQLFGSRRRKQSRSPPRNRSYDERSHGGRGFGGRGDDRDRRHHDHRGRRPRSRSPGRRGGRSRSPPGERRNRSPVREGSAERRAKIEQWNREREQADSANKNGNGINENDGIPDNGEQYNDAHVEQQHQQEHGGYDY